MVDLVIFAKLVISAESLDFNQLLDFLKFHCVAYHTQTVSPFQYL